MVSLKITGKKKPRLHGSLVSLAEYGSFGVEFYALSGRSGNSTYAEKAETIYRYVASVHVTSALAKSLYAVGLRFVTLRQGQLLLLFDKHLPAPDWDSVATRVSETALYSGLWQRLQACP